jgi:short-subunit dehydrogenase
MRPDFRERYGPWALIAGSAVGLGAAYAEQLAAAGLDLVLIDRDAAPLERTAAALGAAHGVRVRPVVLDLARTDLIDALHAATADLEVGLAVYNAALGTVSPFLAMDATHLQAMLDVNCRGPLLLAHALAPAMVARGRGGIILMSSLSGSFGSAQLAVYAASKAFALVLGDALWVELREHGVDVLAVQPGSTRTPGWESSQPAGDDVTRVAVMEPADVVREVLDALGDGPLVVPGEGNRRAAQALGQMARRDVVELMSAVTARLVPNHRGPARS